MKQHRAVILACLGLLALSLLVALHATDSLDSKAWLWSSQFSNFLVVIFGQAIGLAGDSAFMLVFACVLIAFVVFSNRLRLLCLCLLFAIFFATFAEIIGKVVIVHPGRLGNGSLPFIFSPLHLQGSYPSGHIARLMAIAIVVQKNVPSAKLYLQLFCGLSCCVLTILGFHWLSDVVGGLFVGFLAGKLALHFAPQWLPAPREDNLL